VQGIALQQDREFKPQDVLNIATRLIIAPTLGPIRVPNIVTRLIIAPHIKHEQSNPIASN